MDHPSEPMRPWMLRGTPHRLLTCALAAIAMLLLPAVAHADVQVTVGGWDYPQGSDPPTGVILLMGMDGIDDEATATFVPNAPGPTDDELRITSSSAALIDADGAGGPCDFGTPLTTIVCDLDHPDVADRFVVMTGGSGDDSLTVAGPGTDLVTYHLFGGVGDDQLTGGAGTQHFYGEDGFGGGDCHDPVVNPTGVDDCDDTIVDGLGTDEIVGEGGSDHVVQSALGSSAPDLDEDVITLGAGSDDSLTYAARPADDAVAVRIGAVDGSGTPGEADDLLAGLERVVATSGDDTFRSSYVGVAHTYDGGAGDDTFIAGPTDETLIGGAGVDVATWNDATFAQAGVTATANGIADDGETGEADDLGSDIEHVIGSPGNDTIAGASHAECRLAGGGGADTITGPATSCILEGGNGADVLVGGAGDDTIRPGASGVASSDQVTFGGGADTIDYASGTLVSTDSTIVGVLASANSGVTPWCYSLGTGTTSARKTVGGQQHVETWVDAPETILGTVVSDTLCGGPAGTRLEGGAGADVLVGSGGNDLLLGGLGNDLLNGQGGSDTLEGGDGDDNLNGGAGVDVVDGGAGNDPHVRGGGGSDTIRGGDGNDVLDEVAFSAIEQGVAGDELDAADVLDGGAGTDVLDGAAGDDVVPCTVDNLADSWSDSGGGTEVFDCSGLGIAITYAAGPGIDTLVGSATNDVLSGASVIDGGAGDDTLVAAAAGSTIRGGPGNDAITGSDVADVLGGGDGADSISGRGGDDVIDGGFGGDAISGGTGTESIGYEARSSAVNVSLDGVANDGTAGEGDNVQADIEELVGTAHADTLAAGATSTNLVGGAGDDVLVGSPAAELLQGGTGNDRLAGGAGVNVLEGGAGDDSLLGGANADTLDGGADQDTLDGGAGIDRLEGGDGHDVLDGGTGTDVFVGGAGRDAVTYATRSAAVAVTLGDRKANDGEAGEKEDVPLDVENVVGGGGRDRLVGNNLGNSLRGGSGNDTLLAGAGNDVLYGGAGNDKLTGGKGNDKHYGEAGVDVLDALDTVAKDKRLREVVDGGAGKDTALFDAKDRVVRVELRGTMVKVKVRGRTVLKLKVTKCSAKAATRRATRHAARPVRRA